MITYHADEVTAPILAKRIVAKWIKQIAADHGKKIGKLAYIYCSDAKMLAINKKYLKHDYYTDIITFDYTTDDVISGDMFVGIETVSKNSVKYGASYSDELHRVMIHGILHLCGLDDKTTRERLIMEQLENDALDLLKTLV